MQVSENKQKNEVAEKKKEKEQTAYQMTVDLVKDYEESNELQFPPNYSYVNALKSAWLFIQEQVDKDKKPVLTVCTKASVIQALLKMVTQGLSVVKGQCYFVAYGGVLTMVESYQGKIAIAKRTAGVTHVTANAIYQDDEFEFEVDAETGSKKITKHKQSLETIESGKNVKGAYCFVFYENGRKELTVMTKAQIVQSWNQRQGNGLTPAHNNFTDEMSIKTVINRALKPAIRSSDDEEIMANQNEGPKIPKEANKQSLSFDDYEEVKDQPKAIEKGPEPVKHEAKKETVKDRELVFEGEGKNKGGDPF